MPWQPKTESCDADASEAYQHISTYDGRPKSLLESMSRKIWHRCTVKCHRIFKKKHQNARQKIVLATSICNSGVQKSLKTEAPLARTPSTEVIARLALPLLLGLLVARKRQGIIMPFLPGDKANMDEVKVGGKKNLNNSDEVEKPSEY